MTALRLPLLATVSLLAPLMAGCATGEDNKAVEPRPASEYRTGSNIPIRGETPPATDQERERTAEQIRALQRTGSSGPPKP